LLTVCPSDGDSNGGIDLLQHEDAIASVASFLKAFHLNTSKTYQKEKEVILRYNPSHYYTDTVIKLANELESSWR
jgi:membrane-bound lytic murein transglycosylase B